MKYTTTTPTERGYYWLRQDGVSYFNGALTKGLPEPVLVCWSRHRRKEQWMVAGRHWHAPLSELAAADRRDYNYWAGPIPEPEE